MWAHIGYEGGDFVVLAVTATPRPLFEGARIAVTAAGNIAAGDVVRLVEPARNMELIILAPFPDRHEPDAGLTAILIE